MYITKPADCMSFYDRIVARRPLTAEDPCDECMSVIAVFVDNITEGQFVQLGLPSTASDGYWPQDRPGNEAADETYCRGDLEES